MWPKACKNFPWFAGSCIFRYVHVFLTAVQPGVPRFYLLRIWICEGTKQPTEHAPGIWVPSVSPPVWGKWIRLHLCLKAEDFCQFLMRWPPCAFPHTDDSACSTCTSQFLTLSHLLLTWPLFSHRHILVKCPLHSWSCTKARWVTVLDLRKVIYG